MDEFDNPQQPLRSQVHVYSAGQWTDPDSYENTEAKEAYDLGLFDLKAFILRIHLKCSGDTINCSHREDLTKALDQSNAFNPPLEFFRRHTTSSLLDKNTLKEIPRR